MESNQSNSSDHQVFWRKCSTCKASIGFKAKYFVCSVSTCNGQRTGYVFCSMPCWERHLPGARHRDAAAIEKVAPAEGSSEAQATREPMRVMVATPSSGASAATKPGAAPREILVVASKLKDYIRARSEFNTSGAVMEVLSDKLRELCDDAIDRARAEGRKTVLDRDFLPPED